MVAKFNQNLIEAYNLETEGAERTAKICAICARNVEIAQETYGETSLYCVRPIYTLYTARLSEPDNTGSDLALKMLSDMTHEGHAIKANQFLFKAILVNTMLAMASGGLTEQSHMMIQRTLAGVYNAQLAYSEGDRCHPFLEEAISLLCTFFESTGSSMNALSMWHQFLSI